MINESNTNPLENKKEEINVNILGSHFPNISEDNPVRGMEVLGFLKLNSPENFNSYKHKKYDDLLIEKWGSTDYLLDRIQ